MCVTSSIYRENRLDSFTVFLQQLFLNQLLTKTNKMIKLLLITSLFINTCDSTTNYKQDTITVQDKVLVAQLKVLWTKYPLPNVKTPVIIYKPKEK